MIPLLAVLGALPYVSTQATLSFARNQDFGKQFALANGINPDDMAKDSTPVLLTHRVVATTGVLPSPVFRNQMREKSQMKEFSIPIGGEPESPLPMLYWVEATIGTPPQPFRLNLDTGSSTLAIPSADCRNCHTHEHSPFDFTQSSSFRAVPCASKECCGDQDLYCKQYASRMCAPSNPDVCGFEIGYGDGSGVSGYWVEERVTFARFPVDLYFGLFTELKEDKPFEPFKVDGIIGVADRSLNMDRSYQQAFDTVIDAIHKQHNTPEVFSMCFGLHGGSMMLGGVDTCHMTGTLQYTPAVLDKGFWGVEVSSIRVGANSVQLSSSARHEAIVDSGTTLWIVDTSTFNQLVQFIGANIASRSGPQIMQALTNQQCVHKSVISSMPSITIMLAGTTQPIVIPPSVYLIPECGDPSYVGLGIASGGDMNIWGDVFMRPYTWVFDRDTQRVGFAPMVGCDRLPTDPDHCDSKGSVGSSLSVNRNPDLAYIFVAAGVVGATLLVVGAFATVVYRRRRRNQSISVLQAKLVDASNSSVLN